MKSRIMSFGPGHRRRRIIAFFGAGRLVGAGRGVVELRGGSAADRVAAKEWISLFCHESVLHDLPRG